MRFKEFLKLSEDGTLGTNPLLRSINQRVGQQVQNNANAPSVKDQAAGDIVKKSLLDIAKQDPAGVNALTQQMKKPMLGSPQMMKKKMKTR